VPSGYLKAFKAASSTGLASHLAPFSPPCELRLVIPGASTNAADGHIKAMLFPNTATLSLGPLGLAAWLPWPALAPIRHMRYLRSSSPFRGTCLPAGCRDHPALARRALAPPQPHLPKGPANGQRIATFSWLPWWIRERRRAACAVGGAFSAQGSVGQPAPARLSAPQMQLPYTGQVDHCPHLPFSAYSTA
jgi:hypothetical protein